MAKKRLPSKAEAQAIVAASGDKMPNFQKPNAGPPAGRKASAQARSKTPTARSATPARTQAAFNQQMASKEPIRIGPDWRSSKPATSARAERPSKAPTVGRAAPHEGWTSAPKPSTGPAPAPRRLGTKGKVGLGVAAAGTIAAGGYAVHRSRKKAAMSKSLINPFEEVVVFGKAVALPVPSAVRIRTPNLNSGSHRGNALALVRVRNASGGGGPATALERYTTTPKGGKQGPFGHKGNSKIPDGARKGRRIA